MTAVRLAYHPEGGRTLNELPGDPPVPAVRLALGMNPNKAASEALGQPDGPTVRLATSEGGLMYRGGAIDKALSGPDDSRPALLVSYFYLTPFLRNRHRYRYRDWVMDSGAFSAHNSGAEIKLDDYIATCKRLMAEDPTLTEVYALDVIGDWRASLKNCEAMWAAGVPAIPCYHVGEPESVLKALCRDYPKVALGGAVGFRAKLKWAGQCFARVWPKPLHGFGFGDERAILSLPFHSVDATNWELGPCKFGRWKAYGGNMSVRGSKQNLRAEVEWYLKLERRARQKWRVQMEQLSACGPSIRFVANGNAGREDIKAEALGAPAGRLAMANTREKTYAEDKYPSAFGPAPLSVRLALAHSRCDRPGHPNPFEADPAQGHPSSAPEEPES